MLIPLAPANGEAILPLASAKAHLRVLDASEDGLIEDLRTEAIDFVERYASTALSVRDFLWLQDRFTSTMTLPLRPVNSVSDISYFDSTGADVALPSSAWYDGRSSVMAAIGTTWPIAGRVPGGVRITFSAGYNLQSEIPPMLLSGVKVALAALFADRENPDFSGAMRCCDRHRPII